MNIRLFLLALLSYLAGGIPTGYLLAKRKGIDIRRHGSGNPGAANVYRTVGKIEGAATLIIDALKGFIPVLVAKECFPGNYPIMVLCGTLAVIGHVWTVFLKFRGGKGVATSFGIFAALLPVPTLLISLVFVIALRLSGHISVGSIAAAAALPLFAWALKAPAPLTGLACAVCVLILIRHIPNIRRLLEGREPLFEKDRP